MNTRTPRQQLGGEPAVITDPKEAENFTGVEFDPARTEAVLLYPLGGSIEKCAGPHAGKYWVIFGNADYLGTLAECEDMLCKQWPSATFDWHARQIAERYQTELREARKFFLIDEDDKRDADEWCDTNQSMLDAFEGVMGRAAWMICDHEEGVCTEADSLLDNDLMDAAWAVAGFNGTNQITTAEVA